MTVTMFEKEWDVKNPTYKEKRELWKLNTMAFEGNKINQDIYFDLLSKTEDISGLKPADYVDNKGVDLSMSEIDLLLQQVFLNYMGIAENSKKS